MKVHSKCSSPLRALRTYTPSSAKVGGFPKTDEINIKAKGPYKVMMYTDGLEDMEYSSSIMYYPGDAQPPFAAVALAPGYTASGTDYEFMGDMLASHGIAALLTTPTNTNADQPPTRGDDLVAAVKHIMKENDRQGSPLMGKLAVDRIGVTGQSMGGGGTLFAANKLGTMIRCALPMEPWQPGGSFPMIGAPTLIIGAASDTIAAVSGNAQGHYHDGTTGLIVSLDVELLNIKTLAPPRETETCARLRRSGGSLRATACQLAARPWVARS
jgi:hypothetical protein